MSLIVPQRSRSNQPLWGHAWGHFGYSGAYWKGRAPNAPARYRDPRHPAWGRLGPSEVEFVISASPLRPRMDTTRITSQSITDQKISSKINGDITAVTRTPSMVIRTLCLRHGLPYSKVHLGKVLSSSFITQKKTISWSIPAIRADTIAVAESV